MLHRPRPTPQGWAVKTVCLSPARAMHPGFPPLAGICSTVRHRSGQV